MHFGKTGVLNQIIIPLDPQNLKMYDVLKRRQPKFGIEWKKLDNRICEFYFFLFTPKVFVLRLEDQMINTQFEEIMRNNKANHEKQLLKMRSSFKEDEMTFLKKQQAANERIEQLVAQRESEQKVKDQVCIFPYESLLNIYIVRISIFCFNYHFITLYFSVFVFKNFEYSLKYLQF